MNGIKGRVQNDPMDTLGFSLAVQQALDFGGPGASANAPKVFFYKSLVDEVLRRNHIDLPVEGVRYDRLLREVQARGVGFSKGAAERDVLGTLDKINKEGDVWALVQLFAERATPEIRPANFTDAIKQGMVKYLVRLGLQIADQDGLQRFQNGHFDEYFALAYDHAASVSSTSNDPIDSTRARGSITTWDFQVDTLESVEEQGVVRENILAAGALDYIWELGERMGIFRLADALVLNWASGTIDVVEGEAANKLYRYWKLRDERTSPEERAMVHKRVLDKGEAKLLDRMVFNEHFGELWSKLMTEVAEYIRKSEEANPDSNSVSRMPIYQATKELQYNLTDFCTGMAHLQATEMYAQLQEAIELLREPEIVDHFGGGRRKTMWTVIARLWQTEFDQVPNIAAIRTAAVEGNKVFQWIAGFDQGLVTDAQFRSFLESAEAYILAKGTDEGELLEPRGEGEEDEESEEGANKDFDE